jgi:hypothetical protein
MKKLLLCILFALSGVAQAQTINFEDDFSDQDISDWSGDNSDFTFTEESGNILLKQEASGAGTSYLSIPSTNAEGVWEFFVRFDDFNPSDGNRAEIYLMSDAQDLTSNLNGYKLRGGENGSSDVFRLFRVTNGAEANVVLTGTTDISSGGDFRIKVTRNASGDWTLEVAEGYAGVLTTDDTGTDNTYTSTSYFGFKNIYTSTRDDAFFYDFKIDIPPIEVNSIATNSDTEIDVTFSRDIDFATAQASDFTLNPGSINPQSVAQQSSDVARITFGSAIASGQNTLSISSIEDVTNQTTLADTSFSFFIYDDYQSGDIVINEFLKDPPTGTAEYIELRNTSDRYLNLRNWELGDNNSLSTLSFSNFTLLPDSFVVVSSDTSVLNTFYGEAYYLQVSLPAFNNGEDQIRLFDDSDSLIDSLQYDSDWGGEDVAVERRDPTVSSTFRENWGDSPDADFGTPGFSNQIQPDETAPTITSLEVEDNQTLLLVLSERVENSAAETLGNYDLSQNPEAGATTPTLPNMSGVDQFAPDSIRLTLDAQLEEYDGNWTLSADNLTDIFGNTANREVDFNYYVIFTADAGQVAINEFMYDPADGFSEFIELYNHSDSSFNLQNWTFSDNTDDDEIIINGSFVLPAGDYVILAPDSTIATSFPDADLIDMGSRFASLNNSSDAIIIKNQNGVTIDSVAYSSSWGGDEISLERRSVELSGNFQENWGDSPAEDLATPGAANQILTDNTPPDLESISFISDDAIQLIFSERLLNNPATTVSNFQLSAEASFGGTLPSLQSASFSAPDTVLLQYASNFESDSDGTTYELTISNQSDIFENVADDITRSFFRIDYARPDSGEVAINEFMYDPAETLTEFVEIVNRTDSAFNLQEWTLNDNTGNRRALSDTAFTLNPNAYLILTADSTLINNFPNTPLLTLGSRFSSLNNSTDAIVIRDAEGELIDSLTYTTAWGGDEVSLERRSLDIAAEFQDNWGDSPSSEFATPGTANAIAPDESAPEIREISVITDNQIQVLFNERIQSAPAQNSGNYSLSTEVGSITPPGVQELTFTAPDTVLITYASSLPREDSGTTYELTITNQTDIFGNVAASLSGDFFIINYAEPDSGEVFVTEFLYDPPELLSEFVELYNATDSAFNLKNWTFNDNSGNRRVISDLDYSLDPDSYLILTPDSVINENYPGTSFLAIGSRFSSLNNSTDAIVIRDAEGELIDSLTYSSDWGGDEASLERRSINFTPVFKENWGTSPSENLATPGLPNLISEDETAPGIKELSVLDDQTLQVIFTERIQPGPATNSENYDLQIPVNSEFNWELPDSLIYLAPDTVLLSYSEKIPRENNGTNYLFSISNQTDVFGNVAANLLANFFLIDISDAERHDVVINEFMYEPQGEFTEFIELYNPTNQNYDLQGWTLNDNTGSRRVITDGSLELVANSYLVIAPDSSFLDLFPNRPIEIIGSRFSSLNNSTDAIVIRNAEGTLIDSLTYSSDWGGEGVSLERRSPDFPSFYRENWGDSPSENLATPARNNEIEDDNEAPVLENAFIAAADSIRLIFNERVDSLRAFDPENYTTTSSPLVNQVANYSGNAFTLVLETSLTSGQTLSMVVGEQRDIFGNTSQPDSVELEYVVFSPITDGDVIINEILYRRASAESEEFVELYNRTPENYDLSGWTFSDATSSTTIPDGTIIRGNSYLILTDSEISTDGNSLAKQLNGNSVYLSGFPSLNDDEDAVVIKDEQGGVIDSLFYNETWGGNQPGVSLERKDPESASNDASNWATNTSPTGTSAGAQSSVFQPDQTPPEVIFAKLRSDGRISVAFSEFVRAESSGPVNVNEVPTAIVEYEEQNGNVLILGEDPFPTGESINVEFETVTDFRGNSAQNLSIEVSQPLAPGDIVINEILFDPLANSDDNLPDQTEYIELYNRADYAVSLEGFFIHDEPDEDNEIRSIEPVSSQFKWIPAGGTVVFYAEDQASVFSESQLAEYFELEGTNDQFFIRTDRSNLSLASSDDAVYLADSTGATIDSVFYDESWHNPNLFDIDGVSLERIDPDGPSNDDSNWSSSTQVSGGTPGAQNSIFQQAGAAPDETGITFTPNPFSPDDDGFEDNLFINYKLEEPDYLLRVRIFDRYGREVRELADGKQAGFEGSLIWDGLKDDQTKNRVGIYIVLFEAYNSANGKNKTFKETVVLAKKF